MDKVKEGEGTRTRKQDNQSALCAYGSDDNSVTSVVEAKH